MRKLDEAAQSLGACFEHVVCINLDQRPDRWRRMKRRFDQLGFGPVVRFPAIDGTAQVPPAGWCYSPGAYGCLLSHLAVVRMAQERGWPHLLILEDDVIFDPNFNARIGNQVRDLPDDWDALLLGGIHLGDPLPVTGELVRLTATISTFAYALHSRVYNAFLEIHQRARLPVDEGNKLLQAERQVYGVRPWLAWVEEDYSDIAERRVLHWWAEHSLVLDGYEFTEAARDLVIVIMIPCVAPGQAENLGALARLYAQLSPELAVVALVPGDGPVLDLPDLPENVRLRRIATATDSNPLAELEEVCPDWVATRSRFLLTDARTVLSRWDLKSCILMSTRFDVVLCASTVVELDGPDTRKALAGRFRVIDLRRYEQRPLCNDLNGSCILNCRAIQCLDWSAGRPSLGPDQLARGGLSVFTAPGWAYHLHPHAQL